MSNDSTLGISGLAAYVPPYRVDLERWCDWTGNRWDKIHAVVGHGFRMRGPEHSVYTMAAEATLRLIERYRVDPRNVGLLALGTESSTDNAAGAVIVRGLLDRALAARGLPLLARDCEVPEFKHACLGGVYALKGALRYLAYDGAGRQAIVVSADVAEYARGSTGEPTQGAGAVAILVEKNPRLLALDLHGAGSASDYRGVDFRKPFLRFCGQTPGDNGRIQDLPVFNGKYSTSCYIDETLHALDRMLAKRGGSRAAYFRALEAVFMHRPYHRMPHNAWALAYLFALAADGGAGHDELARYCAAVEVNPADLLKEMRATPDVAGAAERGALSSDPYPLAMLVLKAFRDSEAHQRVVEDKMRLGSAPMMEMGNLYTAALPAWLAAGFEEAVERGLPMAGKELLVMGYGSGDAAEAIPARVVKGWESAARAIRFREALEGAVDLTQAQYEALHDGRRVEGLHAPHTPAFVLDRIGQRDDADFQDFGIEYYRYLGSSIHPVPEAPPQPDNDADLVMSADPA